MMHNIACYFMERGRNTEVETLFKQALAGHEWQLCAEHLSILVTSYHTQPCCSKRQGK